MVPLCDPSFFARVTVPLLRSRRERGLGSARERAVTTRTLLTIWLPRAARGGFAIPSRWFACG